MNLIGGLQAKKWRHLPPVDMSYLRPLHMTQEEAETKAKKLHRRSLRRKMLKATDSA